MIVGPDGTTIVVKDGEAVDPIPERAKLTIEDASGYLTAIRDPQFDEPTRVHMLSNILVAVKRWNDHSVVVARLLEIYHEIRLK